MIKKFLLVLFAIASTYGYSQNTSYRLLHDSIYPKMDSLYPEARALLLGNMHIIDPSKLMLLLDDVLAAGDIETYKTIATYVIKERGWNYEYMDTLDNRKGFLSLFDKIRYYHLEEWTYNTSQKYYPIWLSKNTLNIRIQNEVKGIIHSDQKIRRFYSKDINEDCSEDINNKVMEIDFQHILEIVDLCEINNNLLPNNYDNGVGIGYNVQLIIWHNLKAKENFQRAWDALLPYIENTYLADKMSINISKTYDMWCHKHFGYQYYGTLGDSIEIKDKDTYLERKKKYKL